jgi:cysteinyl-tRNA synthetase
MGDDSPKANVDAITAEFLASANLLGLLTDPLGGWTGGRSFDLSAYADRLISLRGAAVAAKDFSAVDALKSALIAAGVEVRMSKAGVELVPGPDFDPARLEAIR